LKTNELSLSHAVVRLCNWQRSNVLADWAKNPDKPPILENPAGRPDKGQKEDVSGETRTYGNPRDYRFPVKMIDIGQEVYNF